MNRVRLSDAKPGAEVVLYKILGGMGMERKLTEMGLLPGEKIQRVDSLHCGEI